MAEIIIDYLDYLVVAADTNDNFLTFQRTLGPKDSPQALVIEVTVGSVQFCVGQPVQANSPVHAAGDTIVLSVYKGRGLYFKAATISDAFTISY